MTTARIASIARIGGTLRSSTAIAAGRPPAAEQGRDHGLGSCSLLEERRCFGDQLVSSEVGRLEHSRTRSTGISRSRNRRMTCASEPDHMNIQPELGRRPPPAQAGRPRGNGATCGTLRCKILEKSPIAIMTPASSLPP